MSKNIHHPTVSLEAINTLLDPLPGFSIFSEDDIQRYLETPSQFFLTFNKERGKGYLYGIELASYRQTLFNSLPPSYKHTVLNSKLNAFDLLCSLESCLTLTSSSSLIPDTIITDIGMGHSVYKIQTPTKSIVLKETGYTHAQFFTDILEQLYLPYIPLSLFESTSGLFQCSEFIDGVTLNDYLLRHKPTDKIIEQLAQHACLGDICGRGDRHYENYIMHNDIIYPIDISYMFYPENEIWVNRYIAGGQSECCILNTYPHYSDFYWECYRQCFQSLKQQQELLIASIYNQYPHYIASQYQTYISSRLENPTYVNQRQESTLIHLNIYAHRCSYKEALNQMMNHTPERVPPLLLMYFHANNHRFTAFFLIDYYKRSHLFNVIKTHQKLN